MSRPLSERRCRLCSQPIETDASKCPHCRGYQTWRAWAGSNLLWVATPLALAAFVGLFTWQYERQRAAELEEMRRSLLAESRDIELGLTRQVRRLQADLDALSGRLSTPIDVMVSDVSISPNRVTLSAYIRDYLRTPPTRRGLMRLSLIPPDFLTLLRERAARRLRAPGLTLAQEAQVRGEINYADRLWKKMDGSVNELIARAADLIAKPEHAANHRKPARHKATGSSLQVALGQAETTHRAAREDSAVERIAAICEHYIRIQMYRCLHTLATLLPTEALDELGNLPPVITREETWESLVRLIYREKGLGKWQENPLAAVHLSGPGIEEAELFFPRDIGPVDLVKLMREQPYFYLGSTVDVPTHISEDNWADHALWQMLSRYEMEPGFRMAWRPSDFTMLVQP